MSYLPPDSFDAVRGDYESSEEEETSGKGYVREQLEIRDAKVLEKGFLKGKLACMEAIQKKYASMTGEERTRHDEVLSDIFEIIRSLDYEK